jgi:hypothetical protein
MISYELAVHFSGFLSMFLFSHSNQRTCLLNEEIAGMIVVPRRSAAAQQTPAIVVPLLIVGEDGRPMSYIVPGRPSIIVRPSSSSRCRRWYYHDHPAGHNDAFFLFGHRILSWYVVVTMVGRSADHDANTKTENTIASGNSCATIGMSSVECRSVSATKHTRDDDDVCIPKESHIMAVATRNLFSLCGSCCEDDGSKVLMLSWIIVP